MRNLLKEALIIRNPDGTFMSRRSFVNKAILYTLMGTIIAYGVTEGLVGIHNWNMAHDFQSPIVFRPLIIELPKQEVLYPTVNVEEVSAVEKPKTLAELIKESRYPEEIDNIWNLETTRGLNKDPLALHNTCKAQGKTNEFGYGGMAMQICFDSYEESVAKIESWLDERKAEAYCYYNQGKRVTDCTYAALAMELSK